MSEEIEPEVEDVEVSPEVSQEQAEPAESPEPSSPWESFRELPQFQGQDDRAIAAGLYEAMQREQAASHALRQYQQVLPVANEYLANRPEFEEWRKQRRLEQQQQQQQAPAEQKSWWNPPAVSESHKRYLVKDENGRDVIAENAPLDARQALTDWMNYKADFAHKFLSNPEEALGPMVQQLAQQQAQELIKSTLETRDNEQLVSKIERENADWIMDPETGGVSPAGVLVHKYINEARDRGINGVESRWEYAKAMTERDLLVQRYEMELQQQQQPQQPVQEASPPQQAPVQQQDLAKQNMEYLKREASRNPSRSAGSTNTDNRMPRQRMTFEQMLLGEANSKHLL